MDEHQWVVLFQRPGRVANMDEWFSSKVIKHVCQVLSSFTDTTETGTF